MIYAVRNDGETSEKLVLRHKKLFFQSRIKNKLRDDRYFSQKPTRKKSREAAIVRGAYRDLSSKVYF